MGQLNERNWPLTVGARETVVEVTPYEQRMDNDLEWAMSEGSKFFHDKGGVQDAMRRICARFDELKISYAVVGGMAVFAHGFRRFTEDVDILVTPKSLKQIHAALDGRGYLRPFEKSKNLRDTESGVRIEFILTGDYPGDGKVKPVAFPDPADVAVEINGVKYVKLPTVVALKLASAMTQPDRIKDFADVQELIKALQIPESFAAELPAYVRDAFLEIWQKLRISPTRFILLWRNKWLTANVKSLAEIVASLDDASAELKRMFADGVQLDPDGGTSDDYARLFTMDRTVANKYGMKPESEFFDGNDFEDADNET